MVNHSNQPDHKNQIEATNLTDARDVDTSGDSLLSYSESEGTTQQFEQEEGVKESKTLIDTNFLTFPGDTRI